MEANRRAEKKVERDGKGIKTKLWRKRYAISCR